MIARAHIPGRFGRWGLAASGGRRRLQLMRTTRTVSGAQLPQNYKLREREGEVPYLIA
jgi:hypothetical protein